MRWALLQDTRLMYKNESYIYTFIFLFFKFYFIFKLYNIVLVLPNIEMNPPQTFNNEQSKNKIKKKYYI